MGKFQDLTSQIFGFLTVLSQVPRDKTSQIAWCCQCNCTNKTIRIVSTHNLKSGNTKSCGCLQKERAKQANTKHGLRYHCLYQTWEDIIQRATNPKHKSYKNYGGRQIKICDEWRNNIEKFIKYCETLPGWDDPNLTLDRINNNGNYEPGNLRFTTRSVQNSNQRPKANTGEKYISFHKKQKKFQVRKKINGKEKFFDSFKTLQEAIDCRTKNNLL